MPVLADDVFLHARVRAPRSVQGPAGVFEKALEVLYLVDYGISTATDPQGTDIGFVRLFDYGWILYAPTIGPVGGTSAVSSAWAIRPTAVSATSATS